VFKSIFSVATIILVLLAFTTQSLPLKELPAEQEGCAQSAGEEKEETARIVVGHFNAIVQVAQLVFHCDFCFEMEQPLIENERVHSVISTAIYYTPFYRTLFRQIISPNAP
jgi:hypothetical protein